jgi:hypothetical protein
LNVNEQADTSKSNDCGYAVLNAEECNAVCRLLAEMSCTEFAGPLATAVEKIRRAAGYYPS